MADIGARMDINRRGNSGVRLSALVFIILALAVVAAFATALHGTFLNWDDDRNFVENTAYRGLGPAQLAWAWRTYHLGVWQPLAWVLLGAEWCVSGLQPRFYHVVSLAIHALNCMMLYLIIVQILRLAPQDSQGRNKTWDRIFAAGATILFAVHPLRVEAVAWISAQPYLPAALFYLLAIFAYLRAKSVPSTTSRVWLIAVCAFFAIAMMFKAVAVSLPLVLLILDYYPLRRRGWRVFLEKLPFILLAVPVCLWAAAAKASTGSRAPWHDFNLNARIAHAAQGLVFYLVKTIIPTGLSPYYSLPKNLSLVNGRDAIMAAIVLAITILAILARRRWPAILAAWSAYVVILLPNLGVVQIGLQLATDRYSYLAMMPMTALLAGLLVASQRREALRRAGLPIAAIILTLLASVGLAWSSREQSRIWHDSKRLWARALLVEPDCDVAHCNLGEALLREGRYTDASFYFSRAIDLNPDFAYAYSNFAVLLCNVRRYEDAVTAARRAVLADPPLDRQDLARAHAVLGQAYAGLRQDDLAMEHTLKARELGFVEADKMIEYLRKFRGSVPPSSRPAKLIKE